MRQSEPVIHNDPEIMVEQAKEALLARARPA